MDLLDRKLLRDLKAGRRQFLAVSLIVALGITLYVGTRMSYVNLGASYERSYQALDFADFTVPCERAPDTVVARARALPGVRGVAGRWAEEIAIEKPHGAEREIRGRVISLPDRGRPAVNRLVLREGSWLSGPRARELLLESQFARYHGYHPGTKIRLVVDGEDEEFRVAGLVSSPEYIIVVPGKGYMMPMPQLYGVVFMAENQAQALFQEEGRVNELCIRCDAGQRAALVRRVEALLKPYGGDEAVLREDQASNQLLQENLKGFSAWALALPSLFLAVAGMTTYTLLTRLVHSQRRQVGLLRAEGISSGRILTHYLRYAVVVGVAGGTAGGLAGWGLSSLVTSLYLALYSIPIADMRLRPGVLFGGILAGMVSCLIGGAVPARAAMRLLPADALRPEPPPVGRMLAPERWLPGLAALGIGARLPLRNLVRNPRRTFYTVLGVASSVAIVLTTGAMQDGTTRIMDAWFHGIQRYDMRVTFLPAQTEGVRSQVASWKGVRHVEPILELPVEVEAHGQTRDTLIFGLPPAGVLMTLHDPSGEPTHVPARGFAAGAGFRRVFRLEIGDSVRVRYPKIVEEVRLERSLRFSRRLDMPFGIMLYAPLRDVQRAFGEQLDLPPKPITGLLLTADPRYVAPIRRRLYDLPNAAGVEVTADLRAQIDEMMKFNWVFIGIMTAFGSALAFAIVYNTVSMAVLERSREIATLRTLGMRQREIAVLITAENLLVGGAGALLGIPLGIALSRYLFSIYNSEQMSMEFVLFPRTYAIVLGGIMLVLFLAQIPSLRHAASLDLARATKDLAD